ncbi:Very-long-chain 3-oxoacyl-CoA reductase [Blattella germanica]|nr:Very-long-chain 3-oxoacyl-CoA reductase [Blattella germanica]
MYTALEIIGILFLCIVAFKIGCIIAMALYKRVVGPMVKRIKLKDMGPWAVVTGATDGLGRAYAEALAKLGINIVLVSRDGEKLAKVAHELEETYEVHTKIIDCDFTNDSIENYDRVEKLIYHLEIGILINNVGMSNPHPDYFLDLPENKKIYGSIIKCNICSVTFMTNLILPKMCEKGRGVIVNISSTAAIIPSPLLTVYGATKAYIQKFSRDLSVEYQHNGIIVQCLLPGFVATKMSKIRRPSWMAPTPEQYVGVINFIEHLSPSVINWVIVRTMQNIRRRALQKPKPTPVADSHETVVEEHRNVPQNED